MELNGATQSVLDDGITDLVREMTESAHHEIARKMAEARGNRGFAYRDGLRGLRERLPEYEKRLIDLHLDLGVRDPEKIAARISSELQQRVSAVGVSIAGSFGGTAGVAAHREAMQFTGEIGAYTAGVAARVRVAVELQRRKDQAVTMNSTVAGGLPITRARSLPELLAQGESTSLDWKRDFWPAIAQSRHAQRREHQGKLLKAIVSIANSVVDERGYLVFGVEDKLDRRTVLGISDNFDDATFQDWCTGAFSPAVHFHYRQEEHGGQRVGIFEITPASEYPHVCVTEYEGELYPGQVWFRRGTRNSIAVHADLKRMFAPPEPLRVSTFNGPVISEVTSLWEPQGWEVCWPRMDERDEKLAQGWRIAYAPSNRREIRLAQGNADVHVLMLRRRQSS